MQRGCLFLFSNCAIVKWRTLIGQLFFIGLFPNTRQSREIQRAVFSSFFRKKACNQFISSIDVESPVRRVNAYGSIVNLENEEDENSQDEEESDKSTCKHSMSDQSA